MTAKPDWTNSLRSPVFSETDRRFARFLIREDGGGNALLGVAAALVSYRLRRGEIFLDLARPPAWEDPAEAPLRDWPETSVWIQGLRSSSVVGGSDAGKPLVLSSGGKLYLHRYWVYERLLAERLRDRAKSTATALGEPAEARLNEWFRDAPEQRAAARNALLRPFSLISGGPGTGKTTTVLKILAMLLETDPDLVIRLAAPTGKAAARLQESIRAGIGKLDCPAEIRNRIGEQQASTLHRLLGAVAGSVHFRHNEKNPLGADLVVLDEASMVDLPLMAKFFLALPASCRVILLGDADQLTSVEAGSVLNGIVEAASRTADGENEPPLHGVATLLRKNFRFGNESAIFRLCTAVRQGEDSAAIRILNETSATDVRRFDLPEPGRLKERLRPLILDKWEDFLHAADPAAALEALSRFQVLTAVRKGPFGRENVNLCIEQILREEGRIPPGKRDYPGRPVMVAENDYAVRLFNGDIGVLLEEGGRLMAFFRNEEGAIRKLSPLRLPQVESAFAMTVHKSQGSEFGDVLAILPDRDLPILSRELLYTAVSRAKREVEIWSYEAILRLTIARKIVRGSGLFEMLTTEKPLGGRNPEVEIQGNSRANP